MLDFSQLIVRLIVSLALGALIGLERELIGKEAGIRTSMIVSGGAALFTLAAFQLPYIVAPTPADADIIVRNATFFGIIASIVAGIGFLGAGIIIKTDERVHGLTTAAVIWFTAAIGTLAGIGLLWFASFSAALIFILLYLLRKVGFAEKKHQEKSG